MVRIKPAAFSAYHGEALVLRAVPQAKASKQPAETELRNTLSSLIFPLWTPDLATASTTSWADNASKDMVTVILSVFVEFKLSKSNSSPSLKTIEEIK